MNVGENKMPKSDDNFSIEEILAEVSVDNKNEPYLEADTYVDVDSILNDIMRDETAKRITREMQFYVQNPIQRSKRYKPSPVNKPDEASVNTKATDDKVSDFRSNILNKIKAEQDTIKGQSDINTDYKPDFEFKTDISDTVKVDKKHDSEVSQLQKPEEEFHIDIEDVRNQNENKTNENFYEDFNEEIADEFELDTDCADLENDVIDGMLKKMRKRSNRGFVVTAFIAFLSILLEAVNSLPQFTPNLIDFRVSPLIYSSANLILLVLAVICSFKLFCDGLFSLFRFRANKYSLTSIAAIGCIIQNIVIILSSSDSVYNSNVHLYSVIAITGLAFCSYGYKTTVGNITANFKVVSGKYNKYGALIVREDYATAYTKGLVSEMPVLVYNKKSDKINNFWGRAFSRDMTDSVSTYLSPLVFIISVLVGAAVGYSMNDFNIGLTVFAAVTCISAPFSYIVSAAQTLKVASKKLMRLGSTIVGTCGVDDYSYTNSAVIYADTLFPEDTIALHGIKTFGSTRIDEAILSAASVACAGKSILTDLFMQIISRDREMLKPVENLQYEDGLGLIAWVEKKRVLIGKRDLMLNYGIDAPSKDYEDKLKSKTNDVIYLSVGGELAAAFIVEFIADSSVAYALRMLENRDISLVVNVSDPVITTDKLEKLFGVQKEMFKILPARLKEEFSSVTMPVKEINSSVISNGTFCSFAVSICEAKKLKSSFMLQIIIQLASVLAGFSLIAVFAFMRDFSQLTTSMLLIYQLIWAGFCILVAKIK